jgi:hypothetical protein
MNCYFLSRSHFLDMQLQQRCIQTNTCKRSSSSYLIRRLKYMNDSCSITELGFGTGHFSVSLFFLRNCRLSLVTRLLHLQSYPKLNESIDRSMNWSPSALIHLSGQYTTASPPNTSPVPDPVPERSCSWVCPVSCPSWRRSRPLAGSTRSSVTPTPECRRSTSYILAYV